MMIPRKDPGLKDERKSRRTPFEIFEETNASPLLLKGVVHSFAIQRLEGTILHHSKKCGEPHVAVGHRSYPHRCGQFREPDVRCVKSYDETGAVRSVLVPHPFGVTVLGEAKDSQVVDAFNVADRCLDGSFLMFWICGDRTRKGASPRNCACGSPYVSFDFLDGSEGLIVRLQFAVIFKDSPLRKAQATVGQHIQPVCGHILVKDRRNLLLPRIRSRRDVQR